MTSINHHKTCLCKMQVLIFKFSLSCVIRCRIGALPNVMQKVNDHGRCYQQLETSAKFI